MEKFGINEADRMRRAAGITEGVDFKTAQKAVKALDKATSTLLIKIAKDEFGTFDNEIDKLEKLHLKTKKIVDSYVESNFDAAIRHGTAAQKLVADFDGVEYTITDLS